MLSFSLHLVFNPLGILLRYPEAVVRKCSIKRVFLNISQNSEENNCAGVSFSTKLQVDYCRKEIAARVFSYKIPTCFIKNISGWRILDMKFFQAFFFFFTHIPETFRTFRERFIFAIISLFLELVPGFRKPWSRGMLINLVTGRNSDYIDKVFMEAFKH